MTASARSAALSGTGAGRPRGWLARGRYVPRADSDPFGDRRWRGGRKPRRYGWDTKAAIALARGVSVRAVERAVERGLVDLRDLRSVARWIAKRTRWPARTGAHGGEYEEARPRTKQQAQHPGR